MDGLPDAIIQIGTGGVIEAANNAVDAIFGWKPSEIIGQPVTVLMAAPDGRVHQSFIDRYLETGTSGILGAAPRTLSGLHKSGRKVDFELTIGEAWVAEERKFVGVCREASQRVALESQRNGALDALQVKVSELETARVELQKAQESDRRSATEAAELGKSATAALELAERALVDLKSERASNAAKEAFYQKLVEIMPAFLIVKNASDLTFAMINPAAKEALGLDPDVYIGKTVADIFPGEEAERSVAEDRRVIETRSVSVDVATPITIASGEKKYYTTKKVAVFDQGQPTYVVTAGQDVSEQVEAQNALQIALNVAERASAAKSEFLAMMSHELRTPLNGVLGTAQALAMTELSSVQAEYVQTILGSGRSLKAVLNDVLDLSKIEAGRMDVVPTAFDVPEMVSCVSNLWQSVADDKGVAFELNLDPDFPQLIEVDGQRLRQVVSNLLSNAVKFTDQGRVSVTLKPASKAEDVFSIVISDTGIGMSAVEQRELFKSFSQLNTGSARAFSGTGLGLAICKQLSMLMGGDVTVSSASGEGTTFTVTLPMIAVSASQTVEEEQEEIELPADCSILVAEDNPTNQAVVRALLGGFGWELVMVGDGAKAVEACKARNFDLILMDINMPVMDGLEATRLIRQSQSDMATVPIIALTADAAPTDHDRFLASGFDLYVPKPIEMERLLVAIATAVQMRPRAEHASATGSAAA